MGLARDGLRGAPEKLTSMLMLASVPAASILLPFLDVDFDSPVLRAALVRVVAGDRSILTISLRAHAPRLAQIEVPGRRRPMSVLELV